MFPIISVSMYSLYWLEVMNFNFKGEKKIVWISRYRYIFFILIAIYVVLMFCTILYALFLISSHSRVPSYITVICNLTMMLFYLIIGIRFSLFVKKNFPKQIKYERLLIQCILIFSLFLIALLLLALSYNVFARTVIIHVIVEFFEYQLIRIILSCVFIYSINVDKKK